MQQTPSSFTWYLVKTYEPVWPYWNVFSFLLQRYLGSFMHLKSPTRRLLYNRLLRLELKKSSNVALLDPCAGNFADKGSSMRKRFPCHDIVYTNIVTSQLAHKLMTLGMSLRCLPRIKYRTKMDHGITRHSGIRGMNRRIIFLRETTSI